MFKFALTIWYSFLFIETLSFIWLIPLRGFHVFTEGVQQGLGEWFAATLAISEMYSGVVPQQPPTMFTKLLSRYCSICDFISSGVSSYSPNALGNPALGYAEMATSVLEAMASK